MKRAVYSLVVNITSGGYSMCVCVTLYAHGFVREWVHICLLENPSLGSCAGSLLYIHHLTDILEINGWQWINDSTS